jgi:hypothetical protein
MCRRDHLLGSHRPSRKAVIRVTERFVVDAERFVVDGFSAIFCDLDLQGDLACSRETSVRMPDGLARDDRHTDVVEK